jgi:hypothetical protein
MGIFIIYIPHEIKVRSLKTCGEAEKKFHSFLTLAVDKASDKLQALSTLPPKINSGTPRRVGPDNLQEKEILPLPGFELRFIRREYRLTVIILTALAPGFYTIKVIETKNKKLSETKDVFKILIGNSERKTQFGL